MWFRNMERMIKEKLIKRVHMSGVVGTRRGRSGRKLERVKEVFTDQG